MKKVLIAWEYGAGFGHVAMIVPVALALRKAGYEPILALKDHITARHLWEKEGLKVISIPKVAFPKQWDKNFPTHSLVDVFKLAGLLEAETLIHLGKQWEKVLQEIKPDLIINEFSPTLGMISIGRIPTISIGSSYSLPPADSPFMPIRFWESSLPSQSLTHATLWQAALNQVRRYFKLPEFTYGTEVFGGEAAFLCSTKELDSYQRFRKTREIGPIAKVAIPPQAPCALPNAPCGYFYLGGEMPDLEGVLLDISSEITQCDGYIRQLKKCLILASNVHLYATPQPLETLLLSRNFLIHQGGINTAELALQLGIPQFIVPLHLEQKVNAGLLREAKVAEIILPHELAKKGLLKERFQQFLATLPFYRANAWQLAQTIHQRNYQGLAQIMHCAKQWL